MIFFTLQCVKQLTVFERSVVAASDFKNLYDGQLRRRFPAIPAASRFFKAAYSVTMNIFRKKIFSF